MVFEVHPLTADPFDDFADVVNPNRRATPCWCLSHRLSVPQLRELGDTPRGRHAGARCREACARRRRDSDGEPSRGATSARAARSRGSGASKLIPAPEDADVGSVICVVVRAGCRRQGHTTRMLEAAVEHAYAHGAAVVEAHPVDNRGDDGGPVRIDTMASAGTWSMFSAAGFEEVGVTKATGSGRPRLVMRHVRG
ncbi:Uncharacterised protein [Micrococcus luteus]|nr:Uncharacterised protein [Micrococcus luteus]